MQDEIRTLPQKLLMGRRALVTGAGRGIGREIARQMALEGADVIINARKEPELLTLREEITAMGQKCQIVLGDICTPETAEKFAAAHAASLRSVAAESEIDLRGMDSMEAVAATERFLDNAVMAKLEKVTIIHGKGTGALRAAVQQSLRRNKAVKSFRLGRYGEGESGVTVVELK